MTVWDAIIVADGKTASDVINQLRNKQQHRTVQVIHPNISLAGMRLHNVFVSDETLAILINNVPEQTMRQFWDDIHGRLTATGALIEIP